MDSVDIQLWRRYRPDRYMCQQQWWWSLFLWSIGTTAVYVYLVCDRMYEDEKQKKRGKLRKKLSHMQFQEYSALNLVWPEKVAQVTMSRGGDNTVVTGGMSQTTLAVRHSYDFSSDEGRKAYCEILKLAYIQPSTIM